MILPRLTELEPVRDTTLAFLAALPAAGFSGEVSDSLATRLVSATDNSVYQILPQAVLYPRSHEDVVALFELAAEPRFLELSFTPRGGGTGTNAQALSSGVIVDLSRHMNRIVALDLDAGTVRVQPGVVLDQLNDFLRPHGVFFAPMVSPSSRATLGGMISTDASGKGSRIYGKTGQHVLGLKAVLVDGAVLDIAPRGEAELRALSARGDSVGRVHREVSRVLDEVAEDLEHSWPKLTRYLTGYNLAMVRDAARGVFDLAMLIAGAEGTLATVTEATLRLTPIPSARRLVVLRYGSFEDALGSAGVLVGADPGAIETIDETVLDLAREDIIYDQVRDYLVDPPGAPRTRTINLVEFEGEDPAAVEAKVDTLLAELEAQRGQPGAPIGWRKAADEAARGALWELRKKGVGLLGARPGRRKPVAFIEDTVVPPERLPAYVAELRALLDAEGVFYGMFGHVDVGCLHVRPALDLRDPEDEARLQRISDQAAALVKRHGGLIWGEHGKGLRSAYSPLFFGERLFAALCEVKGAFDPDNRLNPGKVATPPGRRDQLASIDAPTRGAFDRQISPAGQERFALSISCNGNGACFDYQPDHVMCPSSKVTRDRVHSPKGRSGLMREWLRQLTRAGYEPDQVRRRWGWGRAWLSAPARLWHTLWRRRRWDYSNEVHEAMEGCLACKACATACPVKVDVPTFRAEFSELYHRRYLRPPKDHFVGALESLLPVMAKLAPLTNFALRRRGVRWLIARLGGIVDTPPVARPGLGRRLAERGGRVWSLRQLEALDGGLPEDAVIILQDAFTTFYEPQVVVAAWELARALGRTPYLLAYFPNGKALHVRGMLRRFERLVARNVARLERLAALERPLVGIDPAVTLTYRDEYPHALGRPLNLRVQLLQEWLAGVLSERRAADGPAQTALPYRLFGHCTEKTALTRAERLWVEVFEAAGVGLAPEDVGCCGMSGFYGHDKAHVQESRGIFDQSWGRKLPADDEGRALVLATGYSCRSQTERFAGFSPRHPVEALLAAIAPGSEGGSGGPR